MIGLGEKGEFPASPRLAFTSPPILLCEESKGSEFAWIKTTKRKDSMTYDWTSRDGRGHLTNRKRKFNCRIKRFLFTFTSSKDE